MNQPLLDDLLAQRREQRERETAEEARAAAEEEAQETVKYTAEFELLLDNTFSSALLEALAATIDVAWNSYHGSWRAQARFGDGWTLTYRPGRREWDLSHQSGFSTSISDHGGQNKDGVIDRWLLDALDTHAAERANTLTMPVAPAQPMRYFSIIDALEATRCDVWLHADEYSREDGRTLLAGVQIMAYDAHWLLLTGGPLETSQKLVPLHQIVAINL